MTCMWRDLLAARMNQPGQGCMQGAEQDPPEPDISASPWHTKKRKREAQDSALVIDLSQEPAEDLPDAAPLQNRALKALRNEEKEGPDCIELDPQEQLNKGAVANQQQELKAGTAEEKAALLAKLKAEGKFLKQHVLDMQPLAPLTAENSEPTLSRTQASLTSQGKVHL